jgi:hypothetical protein
VGLHRLQTLGIFQHDNKTLPPGKPSALQSPAEDTNMSSPAIHLYPSPMAHLTWSPAEKAIARKAFDLALQREFESLISKAKEMATKIEQPSDLWDLERYLTQRRQEIDRQYDYRYSVLPEVFGILIRKGRLREEDLRGLRDDKLDYIQAYAKL